MPVTLALAFALLESLALAAVLMAWADRVVGARLLVLFLLGVATWILGNELPNVLGRSAQPLAMALLAPAALTAATFLHFCSVLCDRPFSRSTLWAIYGLGAASTLVALVVSPGEWKPFADIAFVAIPNAVGWGASLVWGALSALGIGMLLSTALRVRGQLLWQLLAVAASCGWGLFCMSGYAIAALNLPWYPWPLLGLPLYPLILVYGILRYRVFVVNAWARRALVWTLLLGFGLLIVALTPLLPLESRWISGMVVAATCLSLNGPVRRLAERLVYPGGTVTADDLLAWRQDLAVANTEAELAQRASALLSRWTGLAVDVTVNGAGQVGPGAPTIVCVCDDGAWHSSFLGWDAAPPSARHMAEFFCTALDEAALRVQRAQAFAEQERARQLQLRLAELGALAATVAHDVRNPLNIISMAVALAPQETQQEVATQVARIANLTRDLLEYAKPWQLQCVAYDFAQQVRSVALRFPGVSLGPELSQPCWVKADPHRLDQALTNLLTNAHAQGQQRRVHIELERLATSLRLHVCDDGPGVPPEIRARLFEPFASRSPQGTGLGLAIVARVMTTHGGTAELTLREPWTTCFSLGLPGLMQTPPLENP